MALAIDASTPNFVSNNTVASTITTASFTPPAGSRLWAMVAWDDSSVDVITFSSSPALTWNGIVPQMAAPGCHIGWANVATSQAYTVTATATAGNFAGQSMQVLVVTGGETTPGGASNNTGGSGTAPLVALTTTGDQSLVIAVAAGWSGTGIDWAPDTNQSLFTFGSNSAHLVASNYRGVFWRRNGLVAVGTSVTMNLTGSTESYSAKTVEIRAGAGGGGGATPRSNWGRVSI